MGLICGGTARILHLPRGRERARNAVLPTARWLLQRGSRASGRGIATRDTGRRSPSTSGYGFILFPLNSLPPKNPKGSREKSSGYVPKGVRYFSLRIPANPSLDGDSHAPRLTLRSTPYLRPATSHVISMIRSIAFRLRLIPSHHPGLSSYEKSRTKSGRPGYRSSLERAR